MLDVADVSTQAQGDQCTGHKGDGVGGQVFEGGCVDVVHVVLQKVWVRLGFGIIRGHCDRLCRLA